MFERQYPNFRNAGQRYDDLVREVVTPNAMVLDLGCGRMSLAANQLRKASCSVGVDLGLHDLQLNKDVDFTVLADGETLPFATGAFDVVVSQWAVEHLERPAPVFAEISRVLKPGGDCILFTTSAYNYVSVASRLMGDRLQQTWIRHILKRPDHESYATRYRANTPKALSRLGRQAGLVDSKIISVGNPFYLAFSTLLFRFALLFEIITDVKCLNPLKLYLLFVAYKPRK